MRGGTWLRAAPAALLVVVASVQIGLARALDLSAWAGGGFGMFSTTDSASARHLHVHALWPGVEVEVPPPRELADLELRVRLLPTDGNLRQLGRAVARTLPDADPPYAMRVALWRRHYDPETLEPRSELLRELEIPVESP